MRLAIINTHPIQYYAPVFKLLHQQPNISVKVFYTYGENSANKYDPGFNRNINWDIPLLDGYPYEYIKNAAEDAGTHTFRDADIHTYTHSSHMLMHGFFR